MSIVSNREFLDICRLCINKKSNLQSVFHLSQNVTEKNDILDKILACLNIKIDEEDEFSKQICDTCLEKLEQFYEFWSACNHSQKLLKQMANSSKKEDMDMVNEDSSPLQTVVNSLNKEKEIFDLPKIVEEKINNVPPINPLPILNKPPLLIPPNNKTLFLLVKPINSTNKTIGNNTSNNATGNPNLVNINPSIINNSNINELPKIVSNSSDVNINSPKIVSNPGVINTNHSKIVTNPSKVIMNSPISNLSIINIKPSNIISNHNKVKNSPRIVDNKPGIIEINSSKSVNNHSNVIGDLKIIKIKPTNLSSTKNNNNDPLKVVNNSNNILLNCLTTVGNSSKINIKPNICINNPSNIAKNLSPPKIQSNPSIINNITNSNRNLCKLADNTVASNLENLVMNHSDPVCNSVNPSPFSDKVSDDNPTQPNSVSVQKKEKFSFHKGNLYDYRKLIDGSTACEFRNKNCSRTCSLAVPRRVRSGGRRPVKCDVPGCMRTYASIAGLNFHKKHVHNTVDTGAYSCTVCNKEFHQEFELDAHLKNHNSKQQIYQCEHCNYSTVNYPVFNIHLKRHRDDHLYFCNFCGKEFFEKTTFKKHLFSHKNNKLFPCMDCGEAFISSYQVQMHREKVHREVENKPIPCSDCGKLYDCIKSLMQHVERKHKGMVYECYECGHKVARKSWLIVHMRKHMILNNRPYKCKICKKRFVSRYILKHHILQHTEYKLFDCTICNKSYVWSSSLIKHQKKVHSQKEEVSLTLPEDNQYDSDIDEKPSIEELLKFGTQEEIVCCPTIIKEEYESDSQEYLAD